MLADQLARFKWRKWDLKLCSAWPDVCGVPAPSGSPKTSTPEHPRLEKDQKFPANLLIVGQNERVWSTPSNIIISTPKTALPCSWNVHFHCRNLRLVELQARKIQAGFDQICLKNKRCGNNDRNVNRFRKNYTPRKVCQPWEKIWRNFGKSWAHLCCKSSISPHPGSPLPTWCPFSLIFGEFWVFLGRGLMYEISRLKKDILGRESRKPNWRGEKMDGITAGWEFLKKP